jgi:hypothetical protein
VMLSGFDVCDRRAVSKGPVVVPLIRGGVDWFF